MALAEQAHAAQESAAEMRKELSIEGQRLAETARMDAGKTREQACLREKEQELSVRLLASQANVKRVASSIHAIEGCQSIRFGGLTTSTSEPIPTQQSLSS